MYHLWFGLGVAPDKALVGECSYTVNGYLERVNDDLLVHLPCQKCLQNLKVVSCTVIQRASLYVAYTSTELLAMLEI